MLRDTVSYDEIEKEIEKMQSSNAKIREESINSLYRISKEIGEGYTVQYLIPFVKTILDTNEESKAPVITQLEKISKEVLLEVKPLYCLYKEIFLTRDNKIREIATNSLISNVLLGRESELNQEIYEAQEFICRLGESKFVMHRISAISLLSRFLLDIPRSSEPKKLKGLFEALLKDALPIIRRKCLSSSEIMLYLYSEPEIKQIVEATLQDADDTVRSFFIHPLLLLDKTEPNSHFSKEVFKIASVDNSWKVRSSSTQIIKDVIVYVDDPDMTRRYVSTPSRSTNTQSQEDHKISGFSELNDRHTPTTEEPIGQISEDKQNTLLDYIDRLVDDREDEVRKSIIQRTPEILLEAPKTKNKILYIIDRASCDKSPDVREIVPNILSIISEIVTKEDMELFVSPIIRRLLSDEDHNTKIETISKLKTLYKKLGAAAITDALAPVINDLKSSNWRTRTAVLKSISSLSRQMDQQYFYEYLKEPFFKMFVDSIWLVRKEAASILSEIAINFGAPWVCGEMLEALEFLKESTHYAHRISYATALGKVLQTLWPRKVQKLLAKNLVDLTTDAIPQVRLTVAKMIRLGILEEKENILKELQNDSHPEVVNASHM
ncbi:serine/threonine-protein phosphatase 2A regulatory subunit A [Nematocida sp. AWRm78]|nr:serine/threonine-protein phosphatase 2A regulatory subunit A [Nematocida sp. AWRm79]KAI5184463.1 serine/threonine-protein phosphatase 2A regulatory subunit A [Nematocida sp. AWRm78]